MVVEKGGIYNKTGLLDIVGAIIIYLLLALLLIAVLRVDDG
jgi:hypothetical protein